MAQLCSTCMAIVEKHRSQLEFVIDHHQQASEFKRAVEQQCYICLRLWKHIVERHSDSPDTLDVSRIVITIILSLSRMGDDFSTGWGYDFKCVYTCSNGVEYASSRMYFFRFHSSYIETLLGTNSCNKTPNPRNGFNQANKWLSNCLNNHSGCFRNRSNELPTRLVSLTQEHSGVSARLCDSSNLPSTTCYLTLSHCWGTLPFFTLKKQNWEQLQHGIPVCDLPILFQDAMLFTLKLGFYYIWIDCLCIVQDSDGNTDWLRESLTMHTVYGNSICNLSATGFQNGQQSPLQATSAPFDFLKVDSQDFYIVPYNSWTTEIIKSPLNRRGWVFQEQVMAPRILHFGQDQLYWECYTTILSELFPEEHQSSYADSNLKALVTVPSPSSEELADEQVYAQWHDIVSLYSASNLTMPGDKLPALSGVVKAFMAVLRDDYIAGLWRKDLLPGLLWFGQRGSRLANPYRAPSWSWASVDGPVDCSRWWQSGYVLTDLVQVVEVKTLPRSTDPTGQVIGGHLILSGHLGKARLSCPQPSKLFTELSSGFSINVTDETDIEIEQVANDMKNWEFVLAFSATNVVLPQEVYLVPLILSIPRGGVFTRTWKGLVLSHEESPGVYKKIGKFTVRTEGIYDAMFRHKHQWDEKCYEGFDGKDSYTIRII